MSATGFDQFPPRAREVFSADEVDSAIERMAGEIERDLKRLNPIVMPILIGGAFAAFRLCEYFSFPYEMDSVRVARYARHGAGELHWYDLASSSPDGMCFSSTMCSTAALRCTPWSTSSGA